MLIVEIHRADDHYQVVLEEHERTIATALRCCNIQLDLRDVLSRNDTEHISIHTQLCDKDVVKIHTGS